MRCATPPRSPGISKRSRGGAIASSANSMHADRSTPVEPVIRDAQPRRRNLLPRRRRPRLRPRILTPVALAGVILMIGLGTTYYTPGPGTRMPRALMRLDVELGRRFIAALRARNRRHTFARRHPAGVPVPDRSCSHARSIRPLLANCRERNAPRRLSSRPTGSGLPSSQATGSRSSPCKAVR